MSANSSFRIVSTPPQPITSYLTGLPTPESVEVRRTHSRTLTSCSGLSVNNTAMEDKSISSGHSINFGLGLRTDGSTHLSDLTNTGIPARGVVSSNGLPANQSINDVTYSDHQIDMHDSTAFETFANQAISQSHAANVNMFESPPGNNADQGAHRGMFTATSSSHASDIFPVSNVTPAHQQARSRQNSSMANGFAANPQTPPNSAPMPVSRPNVSHIAHGLDSNAEHQLALDLFHGAHEAELSRDQMAIRRALRSADHVDVQMPDFSPTADRRPVKSHPSSPLMNQRPLLAGQTTNITASRVNNGRHVPTHRPSHSLGQAGAIMSGGVERHTFDQPHLSAPVSPSESFNHASLTNFIHFSGQRQAIAHHLADHSGFLAGNTGHLGSTGHDNSTRSSNPSVRSTSPSNSMASTSLTSISPLGSGRLNPDGSFASQEASFDSFSTAPSGTISRASSTSEDLFFHDLGSIGLPASMRMAKQKKKLRNIDRKMICDFSQANPTAKQDAIATRFGIERSTVSKILKQKDKWLSIDPESDLANIAKHRAVKFPAVEDRLASWVARLKAEGTAIKDAMIRQEALSVARELGLGEDKFKASGGWIEKFRERNAIPKPQLSEIAFGTIGSPQSTAERPTFGQGMGDSGSSSVTGSTDSEVLAQERQSAVTRTPACASPKSSTPQIESQPRTVMKETPQKRPREEAGLNFADQTSLSPLNQDLARMQFHNVGVDLAQGSLLFGDVTNASRQMKRNSSLDSKASSQTGTIATGGSEIEDARQSNVDVDVDGLGHKRRRGDVDKRIAQSLGGLEPAFDFQFPHSASHMTLRSRSSTQTQTSNSDTNEQNSSDQDQNSQSPQNGGRGKSRRTAARLARKNHKPKTSSPLRKSPSASELPSEADAQVVTESVNAEELATATMEQLRMLQGQNGEGPSIVTAEQAHQSLDLILRFLSEQPSNFVPSNHFVVFGHLQASIEQLMRERSQSGPDSSSSNVSSTGCPSQPPSQNASPREQADSNPTVSET